MQQESKIPYTNNPRIIIEGMDEIIKRDLAKHQSLLEQCKLSLLSFREAVSHEVKQKKHYAKLIGGGKYNDDSLIHSIEMQGVNIRAMSDKVKLSQEEIEHHTLIVDTLTQDLENYYKNNAA